MFAHSLHPQTVNDAVNLIQRHHVPGLDAPLHCRPVGRLYPDDPDPPVQRLQRHRHSGNQPAAANRHHRYINLRKVFVYFQSQCALPGDELHIVERMNVGQPPLFAKLFGFFVGLVPDQAMLHNFRAVSPRGVDLRLRRVAGHHHHGLHLVDARGQRHALRMVARRRTNHAALALLFRQMAKLIQRPANFVRSGLLEHLRLQPYVESRPLAQQPRRQQRRVIRERRNYFPGFLKLLQGDFRGGGDLWGHSSVLSIRFEEA